MKLPMKKTANLVHNILTTHKKHILNARVTSCSAYTFISFDTPCFYVLDIMISLIMDAAH